MRKKTKKDKQRIFVIFVICCAIAIYTLTTTVSLVTKIINNNSTKEKYEKKYNELLKKETVLQGEIIKLEDPDYLARYAREKHLYSKEGEIIFRIVK